MKDLFKSVKTVLVLTCFSSILITVGGVWAFNNYVLLPRIAEFAERKDKITAAEIIKITSDIKEISSKLNKEK